MKQYSQIEIDIDVHKAIEAARQSFDEQPNTILRRLLLNERNIVLHPEETSGRAWSGKGITLPHGTELQMTYNGVVHRAVIEDGRWRMGNEYFKTPSGAAGYVAELVTGERKSLNGWLYWAAKVPGQNLWKKIHDMWRLEERKVIDHLAPRTTPISDS